MSLEAFSMRWRYGLFLYFFVSAFLSLVSLLIMKVSRLQLILVRFARDMQHILLPSVYRWSYAEWVTDILIVPKGQCLSFQGVIHVNFGKKNEAFQDKCIIFTFYFYFMQKRFLNEICLREYCVACIIVEPQATDRDNKAHHKNLSTRSNIIKIRNVQIKKSELKKIKSEVKY